MKRGMMMLLWMFLTVPVMAAKPQRLAVEDRGLDGDKRIYSIRCPDGQRLAIGHFFEQRRICFVPLGGEQTCIAGDDIDRAAKQACQLSRPRKS